MTFEKQDMTFEETYVHCNTKDKFPLMLRSITQTESFVEWMTSFENKHTYDSPMRIAMMLFENDDWALKTRWKDVFKKFVFTTHNQLKTIFGDYYKSTTNDPDYNTIRYEHNKREFIPNRDEINKRLRPICIDPFHLMRIENSDLVALVFPTKKKLNQATQICESYNMTLPVINSTNYEKFYEFLKRIKTIASGHVYENEFIWRKRNNSQQPLVIVTPTYTETGAADSNAETSCRFICVINKLQLIRKSNNDLPTSRSKRSATIPRVEFEFPIELKFSSMTNPPCPIGFAGHSDEKCSLCPSDRNCSTAGLLEPKICEKGFNCTDPANPVLCNDGTYGSYGTCYICNRGYYCINGIEYACPSGQIGHEAGLATCHQVDNK